MNGDKKKFFLIRFAYWLGIGADALWAIGLLVPQVFGILTGNPDFDPDLQVRLIMGIGGTLMTGWTILLIWALKEPIERRFVILLTAYPVVFGMFIVALIGFLNGGSLNMWLMVKTILLMVFMTNSYLLAYKMNKEKRG